MEVVVVDFVWQVSISHFEGRMLMGKQLRSPGRSTVSG